MAVLLKAKLRRISEELTAIQNVGMNGVKTFRNQLADVHLSVMTR
jgi:hypothetical protein